MMHINPIVLAVSVSHYSYKSVEAAVSPEDGSRWLWLRTEQDR